MTRASKITILKYLVVVLYSVTVYGAYQFEHYQPYDDTRSYTCMQIANLIPDVLQDSLSSLPFQPLLQGILSGVYPYEQYIIAEDASWILIKSTSSYAYLLGNNLKTQALDAILEYLTGYKSLVLICDESLQTYFMQHGFTPQPRMELMHDMSADMIQPSVLDNFTVQPLDVHLLKQSPWYGFLTTTIGGAQKFVDIAFGYAIVDAQGKSVAQAYGAFIGNGLCEVGIVTHPDYRGKGYIIYPLYALMQECLQRNLTPVWSCNTENKASFKTAVKFGFNVHRHYVFLKK